MKVKVASVESDTLRPHGLYSPWNSPSRILEWVAFPFSKGSSQPRDQTQVSLISGRFFISWDTREALEYWSGYPISTPGHLPDPGIELESPALQVDSLPTEIPGLYVQINSLTECEVTLFVFSLYSFHGYGWIYTTIKPYFIEADHITWKEP